MGKAIVIDSNLWVSALVYGGNPRKLFELIIRDGLILVVSAELLSEVRRTIVNKFPDFITDFEDLLTALNSRIRIAELGSITVSICRDPNDNMVIETAIIGNCKIVITGDNDLLVLKKHREIVFIKVAQFLNSK